MSQIKRLSLVLLLNVLMIVGLLVVGVASHSLGVLAAGADFAADSVAIGLGIMAIAITRHPRGNKKATSYVAGINAVMLLVVTVSVMYGSIHRLGTHTPPIEGLSVMIISILATVVMFISAVILGGDAAKEDLHMRSVLLDTISDGASAAAVAITGGIIFFTGRLFWLDSAVTLLIGIVIGFNALKLLKDVLKKLHYSPRPQQHNHKKLSGELIFVYNAKSGLGNALLDTGRRIAQPKDYPCALCMITYGPFGMKKDWNAFLQTLPYKVRFLHKDEFLSVLPGFVFSPPGLLLLKDKKPTILLSGKDFESIKSLNDLKLKVTSSLKNNT